MVEAIDSGEMFWLAVNYDGHLAPPPLCTGETPKIKEIRRPSDRGNDDVRRIPEGFRRTVLISSLGRRVQDL